MNLHHVFMAWPDYMHSLYLVEPHVINDLVHEETTMLMRVLTSVAMVITDVFRKKTELMFKINS